MSITVRPEEPRDLRELQAMLEADDNWREAFELGHSSYRSFPIFVAVNERGTVLGMIEVNFDSEYVDRITPPGLTFPQTWIYRILVHAQHRRSGAGRAMMKYFAAEAEAQGRSFVAFFVDHSDDQVEQRVEFFSALGLQKLDDDESNLVMGGPTRILL